MRLPKRGEKKTKQKKQDLLPHGCGCYNISISVRLHVTKCTEKSAVPTPVKTATLLIKRHKNYIEAHRQETVLKQTIDY